jgi:hypothetical protein
MTARTETLPRDCCLALEIEPSQEVAGEQQANRWVGLGLETRTESLVAYRKYLREGLADFVVPIWE